MNISINKNVVIKDYVVTGLLIDTQNATYRKVNSSGLTIAKVITECRVTSLEQLLLKLSDFYKLPVDLLKDDVENFVKDMILRGFFVSDESSNNGETPHTTVSNEKTDNGIWIKVTNRCNLRCKYCYADASIDCDSSFELSVKQIKDMLEELKGKNFNKIVITGGEPLMRNDIVEILETCAQYGKVQLLTNGTICTHELYDKIISIVDVIQISIDSYEEGAHDQNRGKGSYANVISTIKYISNINSGKVALAMTPTPEYKPDIVEMIKFCVELNVLHLHINRFVPYGRAKDYTQKLNMKEFYEWVDRGYDYLRETYINYRRQNRTFQFNLDVASDLSRQVYSVGKKISCGLNCNHISIESNGDVYLCPSLHVQEFLLGNITRESIIEIMERSKEKYGYFAVDDLVRCKDCEVKYYCGGGCRAIALHDSGDIYGCEDGCKCYQDRTYALMAK